MTTKEKIDQALGSAYDIKCHSIEDQVFTVYSKFQNCYARMLKTNIAFKNLYTAILEDRRNNTRLFINAPIWVKTANLIKDRLTPESLNKFNEYVRSTVLIILDSDSKRIDYLRRTCKKPVQTLTKYKGLKSRILSATKQLGPEYDLTTRCFWVMHKITGFDDLRYKCQNKNCENSVLVGWNANDLNSIPYRYCCAKCRANDETYKATLAESVQEKYGVQNVMQNEDVKRKSHKTMVMRHGVEYAAQNPEIYHKVQTSKIKLYGNPTGSISKLKTHFTPEIRKQIEATCERKFGVKHPLQNASIHEKTVRAMPKSQAKPYGATSSKLEQKIFETLVLKFGADNILQHHKSELYPFYCDFYIRTLDTYVEFNGYWMHGGHYFDQNSQDDIKKLAIWREKAKTSNLYVAAIKAWTVRDPMKADIAKRNNLKYVVLWTMNDAYSWIESLNKE